MAIGEGVNSGFVDETPEADPGGTAWPTNQAEIFAAQFVSPAGNNIITELGVWQHGNNHVAANYNMGIYDDNEGAPGSLIATQCSGNMTTENTPEWLVYTDLSSPILPSTTYYIAFAIDAIIANAHWIEMTFFPGEEHIYHWEDTDDEILTDPFTSGGNADSLMAVYAKYEAAPSILPIIGNRMGGNCNPMRG